jgi:N-methylhydantoinase A
LRIRATAPLYAGADTGKPDRFVSPPMADAGEAKIRPVTFGGQVHDTRFIPRDAVAPGDRLAGPLIVEEQSCTSVVPPGYVLTQDALGNLIIAREEA